MLIWMQPKAPNISWINVYQFAAGGLFNQYKIMQKTLKNDKPCHMGTHARVLRESYLVNTNMTGFRCF